MTNQRGRATIKIKSDLHRKKTDADHFSQINRRMLKMGERADRARALFLNGYNCSQAVVGAFSTYLEWNRKQQCALQKDWAAELAECG